MALLNSNKNYIKLSIADSSQIECTIYKTENERLLEKNSTPSSVIVEKYRKLLESAKISANKELQKEGLEKAFSKNAEKLSDAEMERAFQIMKKYSELHIEYHNYINDLQHETGAQHSYPLMKKYFSDVETSIPQKLATFRIPILDNSDIDSIYAELKEDKRFGDTVDC